MMTLRSLGFTLLATAGCLAAAATPEEMFRVIRDNDCAALERLLRAGVPADARDASGAPALMHAALYSDVACMKSLLAKGADPNTANAAGATALMWGVHDMAKVRLLLAKGANVNARSKEGRTTLLIAARQDGASEIVKLLMSKGADPKAKDELGGTALMLAADAGDLATVKLLVEAGVDVNHQADPPFGAPRFGRPPEGDPPVNVRGATALMFAAAGSNTEVVRFLLSRGADPNLKAWGYYQALMASIHQRNSEIPRMLIEKGARINDPDYRGATPLILAAASDEAMPEVVNLLLAKGADVKAKDKSGLSALDWARKRGNTVIAAALERGGAPGASPTAPGALVAAARQDVPDVRTAVEKSVALLQSSSVSFVKKSGCISCHHNSIAQLAWVAARERGFRVDEDLARQTLKATLSVAGPHREPMLQAVPTVPASAIVSSYALIGLAADKHPADAVTDALVHDLAARQRADGRWHIEASRPPLDQGDITATALTLRSLQLYPIPGRRQEFERRVAKAREWLIAAPAVTTQEKNMRLLGLAWAKADKARVREAAEMLLREQRAGGGWSQLAGLEPDAYATGLALVALHTSGMKASDPVYRRGVRFLLETQRPDGSWHVKSRALGFQPYFESGYPYGHDQWVSCGGAAWATMALALSEEPKQELARR